MDYIPGVYESGQPYIIPDGTRYKHIYTVGKTGVGKSTMLENMILADILAGRGFAVLDPHGTLVERIAEALAGYSEETRRTNDACYLDPFFEHCPTFNPLPTVDPHDRAVVADNIAMGLQHVYPNSWGDRMDDILKNALRLCLDNNLTLDHLPKILTNEQYRDSLKCVDPAVADFWQDEYNSWSDKFREVAASPILNKVRPFASNPRLKKLFSGPGKPLDLTHIMDNRKILLCNLSKRLGSKPSKMIGSLLVTAMAQEAMKRATVPEEQLVPFTIYIDEFQNFTNDAMAEMLAEVRKYKISLVLAHQYREQIADENLREAVIATTSTKIIFRVGTTDAPRFAKELNVVERQLLDLPDFQAFVTTVTEGTPRGAERIFIERAKLPTGGLEAVRQNTKHRYN